MLTEQERAELVDELAEWSYTQNGMQHGGPWATATQPYKLPYLISARLTVEKYEGVFEALLAAHDLDAVRLRAQVKYLRDYAISKAAEVMTACNGGNHPNREQLSALIGSIDGNMAVAADRAVAQAQGRGEGA